MYAEWLLQSTHVPSLVLIAQAVFPLEHRHTDKQTRLNALPTPAAMQAWVINNTVRKVCTDLPSSIMSPHSWLLSHSITRSASHDRLVVCEIMEYVLMQIQQPVKQSTTSEFLTKTFFCCVPNKPLSVRAHGQQIRVGDNTKDCKYLQLCTT